MSSESATLPTVPVYDYAIFLSLTALSLGTGLYLSLRRRVRGVSTKDEAFLGSRSLHVMPLALSMVATNVSAMGTIGWVAYFYMHGFHTFWCIPAFVPAGILFCYLLLPVLYQRKVTSIFEYLRMRYGNGVGVASSLIYFVLSQTSGAAGIYSAAIALSTTFGISLSLSTALIGVAGTTYTALGGLRSVVWADCVQAVIMTAAPLTIIGKVVYDSAHSANSPRPLGDLNFTTIIIRTEFDFTTDETVWAGFLAAIPVQLMRVGLDQAIAQRFLAARSLTQARKVALGGVILLAYCYTLHGLTGLAMVYWYRDCDPVLSGSITRYDQIVPYYINKSASSIEGFRGLFMAGLVSASISTVSSVVNSHAAVLYVDIVSPYVRISEKKLGFVMAGLVFHRAALCSNGAIRRNHHTGFLFSLGQREGFGGGGPGRIRSTDMADHWPVLVTNHAGEDDVRLRQMPRELHASRRSVKWKPRTCRCALAVPDLFVLVQSSHGLLDSGARPYVQPIVPFFDRRHTRCGAAVESSDAQVLASGRPSPTRKQRAS